MFGEKKWQKSLALALSLPSTIIFTVWLVTQMIKKDIIGSGLGAFIIVFTIVDALGLMVWYAYKEKNKS